MLKNWKHCTFVCMAAVLAFTVSLISCDEEEVIEEPKEPTSTTYIGTGGGYEWTLEIVDNHGYFDNNYILSRKGKDYTLTNRGIVLEIKGSTYYLKPNNTATTFTATVAGNGRLVELQGTVILGSGSTSESLPGQLTSL